MVETVTAGKLLLDWDWRIGAAVCLGELNVRLLVLAFLLINGVNFKEVILQRVPISRESRRLHYSRPHVTDRALISGKTGKVMKRLARRANKHPQRYWQQRNEHGAITEPQHAHFRGVTTVQLAERDGRHRCLQLHDHLAAIIRGDGLFPQHQKGAPGTLRRLFAPMAHGLQKGAAHHVRLVVRLPATASTAGQVVHIAGGRLLHEKLLAVCTAKCRHDVLTAGAHSYADCGHILEDEVFIAAKSIFGHCPFEDLSV
mmetsp:Transcript_21013/g.35450  ORF Transcript_21013/g.35450 Transcript_21013/m.35450 type:complete len:257 (-) Transcript_21013:576-1346(-)